MAEPVRSCTSTVNPPALPIPRTGGGGSTSACPSCTPANSALSLAAIAEPDSSGFPARSSNGARMTNIDPASGWLPPLMIEYPPIANVAATPGVSLARRASSRTALSVRCRAAAGGNWTLTSRYPVSCEGMNPVGTVLKPKYVRTSKPT